MPKKTQNKGRTKVNDLPKKEKKLSKDERKKVKGGEDARDFLVWQKTAPKLNG